MQDRGQACKRAFNTLEEDNQVELSVLFTESHFPSLFTTPKSHLKSLLLLSGLLPEIALMPKFQKLPRPCIAMNIHKNRLFRQ